jgi:hypothetical protein
MSASVEHLIISKIIEEQSLDEALRSGIKPIHFAGDWEDVYKWVLEYSHKHQAVPSERAFNSRFGHIDVEDASAESFSGLFEELLRGYKFRVVSESLTEAMGPLNKDDVDGALSILSKGLQTASTDSTRLRDFNIIEDWEGRLEKYKYMRDHPDELLGISTGFHGLDRITQGFRKQQWVVMVGEQKRGKSLFQLIMANACHRTGLTPLFVSYEMSVDEQLSRYYALTAKVPYDKILSGHLTDQEMYRIERAMIQAKNMHPFIMSEDSSGLTTVSALDGKIREYRPDALYVDGIYLMDDENGEPKGSPQALTNISRGIKRLAQSHDIPVVGTSQVLSWKLNNKRTRAITADAIGYTSAFAQDADLILGVERDPDIDDQAIIRIVEGRTVPRAEIHVQWDFKTMEFEEVDADGYGEAFD